MKDDPTDAAIYWLADRIARPKVVLVLVAMLFAGWGIASVTGDAVVMQVNFGVSVLTGIVALLFAPGAARRELALQIKQDAQIEADPNLDSRLAGIEDRSGKEIEAMAEKRG